MVATLVFIVILAPWLGALLVWLVGDSRPRTRNTLAVLAGVFAATAAVALLFAAQPFTTDDTVVSIPFGPFIGHLTLVADGLAVYLSIIATVIGTLAIWFSVGYMRGAAQLGRYYALVLLFIGSMCALVLSGNLLFLFLFWEATAFCSYALIAFHNDDPKAVSAGIKALIVTQVGGVGLLIGILIAAAYLPDLQITTLLQESANVPSAVLGVLAFGFLLAAIAKSAQVPLHIWLPDAMEAPTPVSALIHAATMVNAGIYLLARFYPAFAPVPGWTVSIMVVGSLSILLGGLLAMFANDLKRVLAYSTVSQLGYMVAGVGLGALFESNFFLLSHAVYKALLFLCAGAVIHELGTRDMRRMGRLWSKLPQVGWPFLIGAAALMGLPFFNGFWSKELLIEHAAEHGNGFLFVIFVLGAGITAYYTARMTWLVFFAPGRQAVGDQQSTLPKRTHLPISMLAPLVLLAIGVIVAWLPVERFAHRMLLTLPYHATFLISAEQADMLLSTKTVLSLSTAVTLTITALGVLLWWRFSKSRHSDAMSRVGAFADKSEAIFNRAAGQIVTGTQGLASVSQRAQTGQLTWNVVGIFLALVALLGLALWSM